MSITIYVLDFFLMNTQILTVSETDYCNINNNLINIFYLIS